MQSSSVSIGARDYFKQLYDAGGFSKTPDIPNEYVCFRDGAGSPGFIVIRAFAYDETFARAFDKYREIITSKDWRQVPEKVEELRKATNTYETIQQELPYISFLTNDMLQSGAMDSEFFRRGGRILELDWYSKGVNTGTNEYRWNGHSWVYRLSGDPSATVKLIHDYELSIEPAKMRYILLGTVRVDSVSTSDVLSSGSCEKIPARE